MATDTKENQDENNGTGTGDPSQNQEKMLSEAQVNEIVEGRLAKQKQKHDKVLAGVDLDLYKQLVTDKESAEVEQQKKLGEFDAILEKQLAAKDAAYDEVNGKLGSALKELEDIKVDKAMLTEANDFNFHNPAAVVETNRRFVRLNEKTGDREVIDSKGEVRVNKKGDMFTVADLYEEWAGKKENSYAVKPSGSPGGGTNVQGGSSSDSIGKSFTYRGKEFQDTGIKAKTN